MLRVMRMAKDLGIDAYGSPATDSPSDATLERRSTPRCTSSARWPGTASSDDAVPERRAATARA